MASVLVVDDFPEVRLFFAAVVARAGHRFLEADDGLTALDVVRRERPQLIISDIMMPTMDGFEFVRRLRAEPAVAGTPVIVCTSAYHHTEVANLIAGLDIRSVLTKPVGFREALDAVVSVLGGKPGAMPAAAPGLPANHLEFLAPAEAAAESRRLMDIIALGEELGRAQDPLSALEALCRRARDLVGARAAFAAIVDGSGTYRHLATAGWPAHSAERLGAMVPAWGAVSELIGGRPAVRVAGPRDLAVDLGLSGEIAQSLMGVRLASPAYPAGCLVFVDALAAGGFTAQDEQLAALLAAQGAVS